MSEEREGCFYKTRFQTESDKIIATIAATTDAVLASDGETVALLASGFKLSACATHKNFVVLFLGKNEQPFAVCELNPDQARTIAHGILRGLALSGDAANQNAPMH